PAEGEVGDRRRRVRPDARQRGEVVGPAPRHDGSRSAVQVDGAPVVPEALPLADDVGRRGVGERSRGRPALEPAQVARDDALDLLRELGFEVVHDLRQLGEGNVDHLVSGPSGVFMVETKRWEYEPWHLQKAKRQAAKLARELGIFVTPVICLARRRPAEPYRDHGVWILGRERLVDWLTAQRN